MDTHIKEGQLYVQHQKFGKKWKKNWFVLYPASQNGIARLEFYDSAGSGPEKLSTKKLDKKIIRLSECISILPALTENCPKENMSAFCVETNDKTHVFAAEKQVTSEWVEKMCEIAFQGGAGPFSNTDSNGQQDLKMSENLIYYSREEVSEFWVSVQRTDASDRCGLLGNYWLKADGESLILKEPMMKKNLLVWPYKLLRRYGRDRVMFSFEAGRRCESGPGNFTFDTKQGNEIFQIVESAIREQKAQAEEQQCSSFDGDCPALQQIRVAIAEGIGRETDGDSGGSKPGSADGIIGRRDGDGKYLKGRTLPEPPVPVPSTPPRGPKSILDDQVNLYSEPADSVRLPSVLGECLYSDPVDSIKPTLHNPRHHPLGDEGGGGKHEPFYADLYDRVTLDLTPRIGTLGLEHRNRRPAEVTRAEHIYDEPEGRAGPPGIQTITSLYDEARLENQSWKSRGVEEPQGHEVTYNPNTEDYGVPPFGKTTSPPAVAKPKGPKPLTAPKPGKGAKKKEPPPLPQGKTGANLNNNNSSSIYYSAGEVFGNGGIGGGKVEKHAEIYSKVSKTKPPATAWHASMRPPDIIYDNLGDI
ncbi:docking protein 1b [Tachysurus fulvidraco]|uniref:docking protein 1b n=1 Tax=Tachysurus fulvidraco TaxID=1234273 RepID=UPI001FEDC65C|nr:docking protein 1b [Tachysurus fulvidraco]